MMSFFSLDIEIPTSFSSMLRVPGNRGYTSSPTLFFFRIYILVNYPYINILNSFICFWATWCSEVTYDSALMKHSWWCLRIIWRCLELNLDKMHARQVLSLCTISLFLLKYIYYLVLGPILVILRGYSSLCTQKLLLVGLWDQIWCLGLNLVGYRQGKSPTHFSIVVLFIDWFLA